MLSTKPADFADGAELTAAQLNALITILGILGFTIGSGGDGNGDIHNDNIASDAAIVATKIADTAIVGTNTVSAGEQEISRPTSVSGNAPFRENEGGGWSFDNRAGDTQSATLAGGVTALALTASKGVVVLGAATAQALTTLTGGTEGRIVYVITSDTDVTITHTATNTADTIWLRGLASLVGTTGGVVVRLRYSTLI